MTQPVPRPRPILLDVVVIVFSVLLALFLNEWRQGVARADTVATVLETVRWETEANRAEVARALDHHRGLVDQLRTGGAVVDRIDLRQARLDTTSEARFALTATALARERARREGRAAPPLFRASRLPDGRWQLTSPETTAFVTIRGDTALIQGPGGIVLRPPFLLDAAWETAQATQAAIHMPAEIVAAMAAARQIKRAVDATAGRIGDRLHGDAPAETDMVSAIGDLAGLEAGLLEAYDRLLALLPPAPGPGGSGPAP